MRTFKYKVIKEQGNKITQSTRRICIVCGWADPSKRIPRDMRAADWKIKHKDSERSKSRSGETLNNADINKKIVKDQNQCQKNH